MVLKKKKIWKIALSKNMPKLRLRTAKPIPYLRPKRPKSIPSIWPKWLESMPFEVTHTYIASPGHRRIMWVHVLHCLSFYCCRCTNGTVKILLCTVMYPLSLVGSAGLVSSWGAFVILWTYLNAIQVVWRRQKQKKLSVTLIRWQLYWLNLKFFITKVGLSKWKSLRQVCTL